MVLNTPIYSGGAIDYVRVFRVGFRGSFGTGAGRRKPGDGVLGRGPSARRAQKGILSEEDQEDRKDAPTRSRRRPGDAKRKVSAGAQRSPFR